MESAQLAQYAEVVASLNPMQPKHDGIEAVSHNSALDSGSTCSVSHRHFHKPALWRCAYDVVFLLSPSTSSFALAAAQ